MKLIYLLCEVCTLGIVRRCPQCGKITWTVARRMTNTLYLDEEKNWIVTCRACYTEYCDWIEEMLDDVYAEMIAGLHCR